MFWLYGVFGGAIFLLLSAWIWFQISNRHILQLCRAIPSAQPCYPLIGNILLLISSQERFADNLLEVLEESILQGHRAVCFWIAFYPLIMVLDPGDIKKILNISLSRGNEMEESSKDYCKYGLLFAPVDHWKKSRRYLNPSFHPNQMEQLMPTFNLASKQLITDLSTHVDGTEINVIPHVMSAAINSMCSFLYGPDGVNHLTSEGVGDFAHAMEIAGELVAVRVIRPWFRIDRLYKLFYGKEIEFVKHVRKTISNIATMVTSESESSKGRKNGGQGFQKMVDTLRDFQKKDLSITDEQVIDEMCDFFATGSDSISAAVSSCLLALASHSQIQEKLYEEISSMVSDDDDDNISIIHLNRMTYLENIIKETLRVFPIVPFTCRKPKKDINLDGYKIPANKTTILFLTSTSLNPKYFLDPHKFDPKNFTADISTDIFMPFSRGPRNCLGKLYAMWLVKVMVAHVVRKYVLSTNMDIYNLKRRKLMVTLPLLDGYNISLMKRNK